MTPTNELAFTMFLNKQIVDKNKEIDDIKINISSIKEILIRGRHLEQLEEKKNFLSGYANGITMAKIEFNSLRGL